MGNKTGKKNSVFRRILVLAVCVYLLYSLGDLQLQLMNQRKDYAALRQEKNEVSQRIDELERLLETGTEAEIVERAARDRLGFVYADEQVFVDISGN